MSFRKYQKAEKVEVVASADAPETLRKFGVIDQVECTNIECSGACPICVREDRINQLIDSMESVTDS